MAEERVRDAVVVGAGITGLVCAWRLARGGRDVVCLEATGRVGGSLRTHRIDGFLFEGGANTVQETPELHDLIGALDLGGEVVRSPTTLARYVHRGGVLHRVPRTIREAVTTSLVSPFGKLRILAEVGVGRGPTDANESVAGFVARRLGREALEALVAPLISGTFAGDPATLEAAAVFPRWTELERAAGGMIRGVILGPRPADARVRGPLMSFREGLETLPKKLAEMLGDRVVLRAAVESVDRDPAGMSVGTSAGVFAAHRLVLAVPPWIASTLLRSLVPEASAALAEIEAPPLASVSLAWRTADVAHPLDGFGFLVSPGGMLRVLGCLWSSSIFEGRAPRGDAVLTSFVGGARDPASARLDDARLVELVWEDLAAVIGASGPPRVLAIERYEQAIPQYSLGHRARIARAREALAAVPVMALAGNYLDGIAVGDCVRQGLAAAEAVERSLHGE